MPNSTLGELRIVSNLNFIKDPKIGDIKQYSILIYNLLQDLKEQEFNKVDNDDFCHEKIRYFDFAQKSLEETFMWILKAFIFR